jgi:hypothetical protein
MSENVKIKYKNYNFTCRFVWVWNLTSKEHRLRVIEIMALRTMFGPSKDEKVETKD